MSDRFPDFDVNRMPTNRAYAKQTGKRYFYSFCSPECTPAASQAIVEKLKEAQPDGHGQSLWMGVRFIILKMVHAGEIVRIGLTWDIP